MTIIMSHVITCDSEMDRSETMEIGHESGQNNTGNVEQGPSRNDGFNKVKRKLFHREVCEMGAKCFPELCFA